MILRPPSSWPSPPRRRNGGGTFLVLRMRVRQIQPHEFSEKRRTILLLLGEKAGMRESVQTNFFPVGRRMGRRKDVLNVARASARFNVRTGEGGGNFPRGGGRRVGEGGEPRPRRVRRDAAAAGVVFS